MVFAADFWDFVNFSVPGTQSHRRPRRRAPCNTHFEEFSNFTSLAYSTSHSHDFTNVMNFQRLAATIGDLRAKRPNEALALFVNEVLVSEGWDLVDSQSGKVRKRSNLSACLCR